MRRTKVLLLTAFLAAGMLRAQTPQAPAQPPSKDQAPTPLPVPGGGAGLGPGGIPLPSDRPAPTKEETLQKAKDQSDQMADLQARRIAQQLNLSPAQLGKIRAILIEREDILRKAFSPDAPGAAQHPLTAAERELKIQEVKQLTMNRIEAVLNPAQKAQFDAMLAHGRAERSRRSNLATSRQRPVIGTQAPSTTPAPASPSPATPAPATAPSTPATPPQSR